MGAAIFRKQEVPQWNATIATQPPWKAEIVTHAGRRYLTTQLMTNASDVEILKWFQTDRKLNLYRIVLFDMDIIQYRRLKYIRTVYGKNANLIRLYEVNEQITTLYDGFNENDPHSFNKVILYGCGCDFDKFIDLCALCTNKAKYETLEHARALIPYIPWHEADIGQCFDCIKTNDMPPYWQIPCTDENELCIKYINLRSDVYAYPVAINFVQGLYASGYALQLSSFDEFSVTFWSTTQKFTSDGYYIIKIQRKQYDAWMKQVNIAPIALHIDKVQKMLDNIADAEGTTA